MRIAVPTNDGQTLAGFGRARTIAVFKVEDGHLRAREDRANPDPDHLHPAHHRIMLDLVRDCQVVIAAHMGPPMLRSLRGLGLRVLRSPSERVDEAVDAFLRASAGGAPLAEYTLEDAQPGHAHDHGHGPA